MSKLHELLAVERGQKQQAAKVLRELAHTFQNKPNHFTKKLVTFTSNVEGSSPVKEEQLDLQTTVPQELKWISPFLIKAMNVAYQVTETNTIARADVVLEDGTVLLKDMPATALLDLEKRIAEIRELAISIKTLDPSLGFVPDPSTAADVYVARDVKRIRTKKVQKPLVLHPGNDKIAAQVQLITEDVPVGEVNTQEWSGLLSVADKGKMLERVEILARAVKAARQRANDTVSSAPTDKVGAAVVGYVFG